MADTKIAGSILNQATERVDTVIGVNFEADDEEREIMFITPEELGDYSLIIPLDQLKLALKKLEIEI